MNANQQGTTRSTESMKEKVTLLQASTELLHFDTAGEVLGAAGPSASTSESSQLGACSPDSGSEPETECKSEQHHVLVKPLSTLKNDIGCFIDASKSPAEIQEIIEAMSDGQKYHLLRQHDRPSHHYVSYAACWRVQQVLQVLMARGSRLVHSTSLDGGVLCVLCTVCSSTRQEEDGGHGERPPFTKWHHKSDVTGKHPMKPSHHAALEKANMFL